MSHSNTGSLLSHLTQNNHTHGAFTLTPLTKTPVFSAPPLSSTLLGDAAPSTTLQSSQRRSVPPSTVFFRPVLHWSRAVPPSPSHSLAAPSSPLPAMEPQVHAVAAL